MRHTSIFTKTRKEFPKDEESKNAQLLIRAGFINKEMAGVYDYLPFGLMTLEKIKSIARNIMNKHNSVEMLMSSIQNKDIWLKTNRWDSQEVDIWYKTKLYNDTEIGFGWSHEEPFCNLMINHINSYKDLPIQAYQFQTKFRNEKRAKSGIMRGREFVMKDLYSFSKNLDEHHIIYNDMMNAYREFYNEVGLGNITYITHATGGVFTKQSSHEFQTICDAGEDIIYIDREKNIAYNEETIENDNININKLEKHKAAEVGNIFSFGDEKSLNMDLNYVDVDGLEKPVILGSYGIGISRVMGVVVEKFSDNKGIIWPKNISPFLINILSLHKDKNSEIYSLSEKIYNKLNSKYEVLFDDRNISIKNKLEDADLYGFPIQIIIGEKTLEENSIHIVNRQNFETFKINKENIDEILKNIEDVIKVLY